MSMITKKPVVDPIIKKNAKKRAIVLVHRNIQIVCSGKYQIPQKTCKFSIPK